MTDSSGLPPVLARDIAAANAGRFEDREGPEPWQKPEPSPAAKYSVVGDSLSVEVGEGVTEVTLYDIPTLLAAAGRPADRGPGYRQAIADLRDLGAIAAWRQERRRRGEPFEGAGVVEYLEHRLARAEEPPS